MTKLDYLEDTYLFESKAEIIKYSENEFGKYILLDKTIFYPQGGGQPTDTGKIVIGKTVFKVKNVRLNEEGIVFHYGEFLSESLPENLENSEVELFVNSENRIINAKNHTAGHLVDIAMKNIGIDLTPTKGFHFKEGCYVEYSGSIELDKLEIIEKLNSKLKDLISKNLEIIVENSENDINNINSPKGKSFRFVYFHGYKNLGCGCGGTHLKNTGEIGKITIKKIKEKKGTVKISYKVL